MATSFLHFAADGNKSAVDHKAVKSEVSLYDHTFRYVNVLFREKGF